MAEQRAIRRRTRADIDDARAPCKLGGLRRDPAVAIAQVEGEQIAVAQRGAQFTDEIRKGRSHSPKTGQRGGRIFMKLAVIVDVGKLRQIERANQGTIVRARRPGGR